MHRSNRRRIGSLVALLLLALSARASGDPAGAPPGREAPAASRAPIEKSEEEALWGRFRRTQSVPAIAREQRELLDLLNQIGYVSGSQSASGSGVQRYRARDAYQGINFYTSGHAPEAVLMDMQGAVLHRWHFEAKVAWPDLRAIETQANARWWRRAKLLPDGSVLAIFAGIGIVKLDRDSKLLWARLNGAHHDLEVQSDGSILTLTREWRRVDFVNPEHPVLEDLVVLLDAKGRELRRVSLLEAFERSPFRALWRERAPRDGDILHANSVFRLDGRLAERDPAFRAGNVLISSRTTNLIAILDLDAATIVWARAGSFRGQHDPKLVGRSRMLLFDNLGLGERSRVIEMDPIAGRSSWVFEGSAAEPFFSRTCGSAERLPNGNLLIVESDNGRAFELTRDKRVVWEFWNPNRAGEKGEWIATLFDLERLPPDYALAWLAPATSAARERPQP
jgi:hypothetical protein